jgi:altronate dehydratase small subunit
MKSGKSKRVIRLTKDDNVATAIEDIDAGDTIHVMGDGSSDINLVAENEIRFGHKIALEEIEVGETIFKYGESIGVATETIHKGEHVHTHNLSSARAMRGS